MVNTIGMNIYGRELIKDGVDDVLNGLNDSLEHTMFMLIEVTGEHKYYVSDDELTKLVDDELAMGGIINPRIFEYYIINEAKDWKNHKIVDKRNKKEVQKVKDICDVCYNLYEVGVNNPNIKI